MKLVEELGDHPIGLYPHRQPWGLYDILDNCQRKGWDRDEVFDGLRQRYKAEGYPAGLQTYETGILIRRNNDEAKRFDAMWWKELSTWSIRDQASFTYVAWKLGVSIRGLNGRVDKNPYFRFIPHDVSRPHYDDPQMKTGILFL
jgi:hypothetical protein